MQKPSEHHKLTSDNNIIKFKKPVHDFFKICLLEAPEKKPMKIPKVPMIRMCLNVRSTYQDHQR